MKLRRIIAVLLATLVAFTVLPISAFAESGRDLGDCEIRFDGEGWREYIVENLEDTFDLDDLRITVVDGEDNAIPTDAYTLTVGYLDGWDINEVSAPFGADDDPLSAEGIGNFGVYATAKEDSGYTGRTGDRHFRIRHRYCFDEYGVNVDLDWDYHVNNPFADEEYFRIPQNRIREPEVRDSIGESLDPEQYTITYYERNTEVDPVENRHDPEYLAQLHPETDALEGMPGEQGCYFLRIDGNDPYYGSCYVDFDIIAAEAENNFRKDMEIRFDGEDWKDFIIEDKDETVSLDELKISVIGRDGSEIDRDKYDIVVGIWEGWDEENNMPRLREVEEPYGLNADPEFTERGYAIFDVYAAAKEDSGYVGTTNTRSFAIRHLYSFNEFCVNVGLDWGYHQDENPWGDHNYFIFPANRFDEPEIWNRRDERVDPEYYMITYYKRNTDEIDFDDRNDPEYLALRYPEENPLDGRPTENGSYFMVAEAVKEPYYGKRYVDFDIVDAEEENDFRRDVEIRFDGEDWKEYILDNKDDALTLDQLNITLVDHQGSVVPKDAYDLVIGFDEGWDDKNDMPRVRAVDEPFGLSADPDFYEAGSGYFTVYAIAKEDGGYRGCTDTRDFRIRYRYSINDNGVHPGLPGQLYKENHLSRHDLIEIPVNRLRFDMFDNEGNRLDPQYYEITWFRRGEGDFDWRDPEYMQKLYPETEPLDGTPTEPGAYFMRVDAVKAPYTGTTWIDFDITEEQAYTDFSVGFRLLFDGEDWKVYPIENKTDTLTVEDLNITLMDDDGNVIPRDKYDLVIGTFEWDDELWEDIFTEMSAPYGLEIDDDFLQAGFGGFAAYAVAKDGSGFTGQTDPREFMIWHKYSFNWFGANAEFGGQYWKQCTWSWHDYYEVPENRIEAPRVHGIAGDGEIDPQCYDITYFVRNTEIPDFDDPDYDKKVYPETEPLEGLPTEQGHYFARIDGKEPYYGTSYVDFDIVEAEEEFPDSFALVRGSDRRYHEGQIIFIPEGGEVYIRFDTDPYTGLIPGWRSDLLREDGFDIDVDPVFFEGDDYAYAHITAGDLPAGTRGTLYYVWYRAEDVFDEHGGQHWDTAQPIYATSVDIEIGEERDPEIFAFLLGEEGIRYYNGDTISVKNGDEIFITFDLTYIPPEYPLADRSFDLLKEAGFMVDEEFISFEDAGYRYTRIKAEDLAPGTKAAIPVTWYSFDDYLFGGKENPLYDAVIYLEVADEPAGFIIGDVDGDGEVTIIDVTLIQRRLAELPTYAFNEVAADVDRNGNVESIDATLIQRWLAEMIADAGLGEQGVYGTYYAAWNIEERLLPDDSGLTGVEAQQAEAEIRSALDLLFDRRGLNEAIGIERKAASSFVSDYITDADGLEYIIHSSEGDFYGYFDVNAFEENRDAALNVLKQYYDFDEATGKFTDVPVLSYCFNEGWAHQAIAEYIRDDLGEYGVTLELKALSWENYYGEIGEGNFSLARGGWVVDYDDPLEFLSMWTSDSEDNIVGFGRGVHGEMPLYSLDLNPYGVDLIVENGTWAETYDKLIEAIRTSRSKAKRYEMMHLAEDMLMDTGCILPLYYY